MKKNNLKYFGIILPISATERVNVFEQVKTLTSKHVVVGLEAFSITQLTALPNAATPISEALFKDGYLTLNNNEKEELSRMPLRSLRPTDNNGMRFECNLENVDWQKSFVDFSRATNLAVSSLFLGVFYMEKIDVPKN